MTNYKQFTAWLHAQLGTKLRDERGFSVSSEQLWWIIGIAAIVGIVITFLTNYIQGLLAQI